MPKLLIDTFLWQDSFVFDQNPNGKLLYFYCLYPLKPRAHGIIIATPKDIHNQTKLLQGDILNLLKRFSARGKIKWIQQENKIWVKDYILTQTMSPTYAIKLKVCLRTEAPELIWEYINYYNDMGYWAAHGINIDDIFDPPKPKSKGSKGRDK